MSIQTIIEHEHLITVPADLAEVSIRIRHKAHQHDICQKRMDASRNRLFSALSEIGLLPEAFRTSEASASFPDRSYGDSTDDATIEHDLQLILENPTPEFMSALFDRLIESGNAITYGTEWRLKDPSAAKTRCIQEALATLDHRAKAISPSGNARLTKIEIDKSEEQSPILYSPMNTLKRFDSHDAPKSPSLKPADITVTTTLTVTYQLD